jgi:hypothetical protein
MLAGFLILIAILIGIYEGRQKSSLSVVVYTAIILFVVSNLVFSWPYFIDDPSTWMRTYVSAILLGGSVSLLLHIAPFLIAYRVGRWMWSR